MRTSIMEVIGVVVLVVLVVGTIVVGVRECNRKQRCEDGGGKVENYDCQWVMMPCGDSCWYPMESCEWRCVGGSAEARP